MRGEQPPSDMGNQEAKQRKAAAAASSGDGSNTAIDEGWREGGGDKTKKGKKSLGRNEGKGAGGGGGEPGTWPAKKKNKSESKSSVFSIRKRKSNLKGKGGAGSKEDVLACQHDELDSAQSQGTKTPDLSADELGQSDAEAATHCGPLAGGRGSNTNQKREAGEESVEVGTRKAQQPVSPLEEGGPKGGSSGSDTDIYSFHSATDHEDLLADIQLAIRLQHQQKHNGTQLISEPRGGQDGSLIRKYVGGEKNRLNNGGEASSLTSSAVLQLTPELELGSDALSFLDTGRLPSSASQNGLVPNPGFSLTVAEREVGVGRGEVGIKQGDGVHAEEKTQDEPESPEVSSGLIDQRALVEHTSFHTSITTAVNRATAESLVAEVTTRVNRLPDLPASFENVVEPPVQEEGKRSEVEEVQIVLEGPCCSADGPGEEDSESDEPIEGLTSGRASREDGGPLGTGTSVESLSACLSAESEAECLSGTSTTTSIPVPQHRRSPSQWPPQESPTVSALLLKMTTSSASSTSSLGSSVKPYPPIFASYIKTTTRQLSSPGVSPGLSPAQSPLSHRRVHSQVHRYARAHGPLSLFS